VVETSTYNVNNNFKQYQYKSAAAVVSLKRCFKLAILVTVSTSAVL